MKNIISIVLLASVLNGFCQSIKNVSASEFKKQIDAYGIVAENLVGKKAVLIDLRTPAEIKSKGKIKGAVEIDFLAKDSESIIEKLDKNKSYLIYCAGGGRSGDCAELMQKKAFKEIINLEKGFDDWKKTGNEIELKP